MAEKPILFSTAMVRAILDDDKTMTRRLNAFKEINKNPDDWFIKDCYSRLSGSQKFVVFGNRLNQEINLHIKCAFPIGTKLWVRETWCKNENPKSDNYGKFEYRADYEGAECQDLITWKPSIFMPKEAARIWSEVTDNRIERLQEITAEDCMAEGIKIEWSEDIPKPNYHSLAYAETRVKPAFTDAFKQLWDILNAKRGFGWNTNPWVEVVTFKRTEV